MIDPLRRQAVVTGIGVVSPVGRGAETFFDALCRPTSGLVRPPEDHVIAGMVDAAGIAPEIDPLSVVPRTDAHVIDPFAAWAVAAADDAVADAGIVINKDVDPFRVAVVISSGAGGMKTYETQAMARIARGSSAVSSYLYAGYLPNMAAARVAIKYDIRGYSTTMSTACAASAHAVAEGLRLISAGDADVVLCGGTEAPLGQTGVAGFGNARALANGWDNPTEASRPFDRRRNGFVLGEGGAVLVLERPELADARDAAGYANLTGWGATTDAYHLVMPRPDGSSAAECMRMAIARAGISEADVDYVNAHGTGTRIGDIAEARALKAVFGRDQPAVSSTKGVTGHMLGGAGAVESAATALAVARGTLPPTMNLDEPDSACDLDHVRKSARLGPVKAALSNSFAFGGHNVSLVFQTATTRRVRTGDPATTAGGATS